METIRNLESEVRSYCRSFPAVFVRAQGHTLTDDRGRSWLDFFSGAGALNYGHNPADMRQALVDYLLSDGVTHSLDMVTDAKIRFLDRLNEVILEPRGLDHVVQFPGPTGTNAVEAALKLARKVTGRTRVIGFDGGFHGMTLGSLAVTTNSAKRAGARVPLRHAVHVPFDGSDQEARTASLEALERELADCAPEDRAAAVLVETVQGEGGVRPATFGWLAKVADLAREHDALLIVDDIQAGCGRTGPFFSFEPADIKPDIITLSKSLSGYGLPLSVVLLRRDLDEWTPGEHNGTFRGHNPAFVTATVALDRWVGDGLEPEVTRKGARVRKRMDEIAAQHDGVTVRGRGLLQGFVFEQADAAGEAAKAAFENGLVAETSGPDGEVLKVMPPLVTPDEALDRGLDIMDKSMAEVLDTAGVA